MPSRLDIHMTTLPFSTQAALSKGSVKDRERDRELHEYYYINDFIITNLTKIVQSSQLLSAPTHQPQKWSNYMVLEEGPLHSARCCPNHLFKNALKIENVNVHQKRELSSLRTWFNDSKSCKVTKTGGRKRSRLVVQLTVTLPDTALVEQLSTEEEKKREKLG